MRAVVVVVALAGCYQPASLVPCAIACTDQCPGDLVCGTDRRCHAPGNDSCAVGDAPSFEVQDLGAGSDMEFQVCFGSGIVTVCFPTAPTGNLDLNASTTFSTDGTGICQPMMTSALVGPIPVCVIAAGTIIINGTLRATGSRPLVLVATTMVTLNQTIDVSSNRGGMHGAGPATCRAADGAIDGMGGAGGAGGGNGTSGGAGGASGATTATAPMNVGNNLPSVLSGGCGGGFGGPADGTAVTTGGEGGGSVAIIAPSIFVSNGTILASGAGGLGGSNGNGGNGGGAGGTIVLDGSVTLTNANLVAEGGGGGGGTGLGNFGSGGGDGGASGGLGGGGATPGTEGGDGSSESIPTGSSAAAASGGGGGGGGGGGAGFILIHGPVPTISGGTIAPAFRAN